VPLFRLPPWKLTRTYETFSQREHDWWVDQFRAPEVFKRGRGKGIVIAILDTGCDLEHPDLKSQILKAKDFTKSPYGPLDVNKHGTHVAGLAAAAENDLGVLGMAPDAKLLIAKCLGDDGSGYDAWIVNAIKWAISEGADILSLSLGSLEPSPRIVDALLKAIAAGLDVVMAAGNEGGLGVGWPAQGVVEGIRVAAADKKNRVPAFSSKGDQVDVAAPGVDLLSCLPGGKWGRMSGTSMATPIVSGLCACIRSASKKKLSPAEVKKRIVDSAEDAGAAGKDPSFGHGLLRPDRAMEGDEPVAEGIDIFGLIKALPIAKGTPAPHAGVLLY